MQNLQLENSNRILIADDDPVILDIVQTLVEAEGYDAVTAANGLEAYRILRKDSNFAAVILDLIMPHLEGSDLLQEMQTEKRLSRIPVIIMSSSDDLMMLSKSTRTGAVAFVPKPFTPHQMRNVLELITQMATDSRKTVSSSTSRNAPPPVCRPISVLMIEDNPGEAIVIESALLKAASRIPQLSNLAITHAGLLSDGIDQIVAGHVDMVFLDLSLPDSEGLNSLKRILEQDPGIPVVVLTATEDRTVAGRALKLGAQNYLVKGQVDHRGMLKAVRDAFEVRQASVSFFRL